jgi:PD-(D/E)XK nuclease superfamily
MNKLRASYTLLNTWSSGNWDQAIKNYFKLEKFVTPAMLEGQKWHQTWADEIIKTKAIPKIFGDKKFVNPIVEKYEVVELDDWLDLSGKIDCLDGDTIYDWKTGKQTSEASASSMQIGVYGVFCTQLGFYVKKGEIYHYDQYMKTVDMSIIWITDKLLEDAYNWIFTIAGEIQTYFLDNNLYTKFFKPVSHYEQRN